MQPQLSKEQSQVARQAFDSRGGWYKFAPLQSWAVLCNLLRIPFLLWFFVELRVRCVIPGVLLSYLQSCCRCLTSGKNHRFYMQLCVLHKTEKRAELQWERNIEVKTVPGPLHSLPCRSLSFPLPSQIYLGGQFWGSLYRKGYDPSHGCPPNVSISIGAIASGFLMTVQGYPLERQQLKLTRHFGGTIHSEFCLPPRQCYGFLVGDHIILVPSKINFVPRFWSPRDKSLCFPDFLDFKLLSPVIISPPFSYSHFPAFGSFQNSVPSQVLSDAPNPSLLSFSILLHAPVLFFEIVNDLRPLKVLCGP